MASGGLLVRVKTHRDKHGGETILLTQGGENSQSAVIYAHRTIPGLRLARHPFDEETIRLLEHLYPHLEFDWPRILRAIVSPAAPPPDAAPAGRGPRGRTPDEPTSSAGQRSGDRPRQPSGRDGTSRPRAPRTADARSGVSSGARNIPERTPGSATGDLDHDTVSDPIAEAAPQREVAGDSTARSRELHQPRFEPASPAEDGDDRRAPANVAADNRRTPEQPSAVAHTRAPMRPGESGDANEDGEETGEPEDAEDAEIGGRPAGMAPATNASVSERHGSLVQRIHQRVRDPVSRAALLAEAAALEAVHWTEPLAPADAARFELLFEALRKQLPSRRRRRRKRGSQGSAPGAPSAVEGAAPGGTASEG